MKPAAGVYNTPKIEESSRGPATVATVLPPARDIPASGICPPHFHKSRHLEECARSLRPSRRRHRSLGRHSHLAHHLMLTARAMVFREVPPCAKSFVPVR